MKRLLTLALLFGFFTLPISCVEKSPRYSILELGLLTGRLHTENYPYIESYSYESTTDTLSSEDFGIEIYVDEYGPISANWNFENPFITTAYADEPVPIIEDKLALISISCSDTVFTSGTYYLPGASLTSLFQVESGYSYEPVSILKFIEESGRWYYHESIFLGFQEQLDKPIQQTFLITVTLEDGSIFDLETPVVRLK